MCGRLYSLESTFVKPAVRELALASLFSDLVRLETELWDVVETRLRRDHHLELTWFEPMQVIERTPNCRVSEIAQALSITVGGTSKLVDRLANAGLCERLPNPEDGRSSTILLSDAGRALLAAATRTFNDEVGLWLGETLSTSELEGFAATIHKLRKRIQTPPARD